jgi:hypothetical protein
MWEHIKGLHQHTITTSQVFLKHTNTLPKLPIQEVCIHDCLLSTIDLLFPALDEEEDTSNTHEEKCFFIKPLSLPCGSY